jgi:hypothetical protein
MSNECILSILKKTEQSETILRHSAVRCSGQLKFHMRFWVAATGWVQL